MCVGFLYTEMISSPFMRLCSPVSRNGRCPCVSSSIVNRMVGSWLFRCVRNSSTACPSMIQKVSHTTLIPQSGGGGGGCIEGKLFKLLHVDVCYNW